MNAIKTLTRDLLASIWRLFFLSALSECVAGKSTKVNYWRVRPSAGGRLYVGSQSLVRAEMVYERPNVSISIGSRTFVGRGLFTIAEKLTIGDDVMISWNVTIADHNSHSISFSERRHDVTDALVGRKDWENIRIEPVVVQNKVWIGFGASILRGVSIGEGAVVAANSVVTKNVDAWTIVGGNPARELRRIPEKDRWVE